MKRILLIEDETPIAEMLQAYLEQAQFAVTWDAGEGNVLDVFLRCRPDLVLLDLMLPDNDGLDLLQQIRKYGSCPIIILTARGSVPDRLEGLQRGADDYISKPFDPDEVVARVQAVLRRSAYLEDSEVIRLGRLIVDYTARTVALYDQQIVLTPRDWNLLAFLVRHPNQCFSRLHLLDHVWGIDYDGGDRAVDASIKRIRQSLQDWPTSEGEIQTIRGTGYMLHVK
ncbi:transcriptional regulator [Brevibacillus panacihumi W25]|uniref:Transcriptional regulator n=1 Tax=Brevibacillus panacihumi W25 TaxID=1408254 RepID=V6M923_9BACL|nr:response regulator transcription factor [Brevibacillus panacihumi]EST51853.1 transcriptional regulator [Brevibacillus panacihumi W25]